MLSYIWGIFSFFFSSVSLFPQPQGPYPSLEAFIPASRPTSQTWGPNSNLKAQIPTPSPKFQPQGIWALRLGFWPCGWDMGLEAEIWGDGEIWGRGVRRRRRRRRSRKFPICVKLKASTSLGPLPCSLPELQSQSSNAFATTLSTPKEICSPKVVNINGYSRKNIRLSVSVSIRNWIVVELWLHVTCILCKFANV